MRLSEKYTHHITNMRNITYSHHYTYESESKIMQPCVYDYYNPKTEHKAILTHVYRRHYVSFLTPPVLLLMNPTNLQKPFTSSFTYLMLIIIILPYSSTSVSTLNFLHEFSVEYKTKVM